MSKDDPSHHFPGFSSPTYTIVPDELFDDLLSELSGAELKVLLYIIRRTFGFKKDSDTISLKQMAEGIVTRDGRVLDRGAGVAKSAAAQAVKTLREKGYIVHQRNRSHEKGDEPTTYALRFRDAPVSRKWTGGYPENGQARVQNQDTQETGIQETDVVSSNSIHPPQQKLMGEVASKFRKGSHPHSSETKGIAELAASAHGGADGITRPREVLQAKGLSREPTANLEPPTTAVALGAPMPPTRTAHQPSRRRATLLPEAEQAIQAYLGDFAPELGDQAPFQSSVTRVCNLYAASGLTVSAFIQRMYAARARTKERYPAIRSRTKRFAYWLAVLEHECGVRSAPMLFNEPGSASAAPTLDGPPVSPPPAASRREPATLLADGVGTQLLWQRVLRRLEEQMTRPSFETYLRGTVGIGSTDGRLVVETPSEFVADWLRTKLAPSIGRALQDEAGMVVSVEFVVKADATATLKNSPPEALRRPRTARRAPGGRSG
jgi:hypothetical protein